MRNHARYLRLVPAICLLAGLFGMGLRAVSGAPAARPNVVVVVPISGTVDAGMAHLVARAVAEARDARARAVVLVVNSPGGLVAPAMDIRDALFDAGVPTVAFVSQRAYSAAALVTLSAQRIYLAPGASIGDAQPIPNTPKLVSGLSAEFASTASRNHRNPKIAEAMVDAGVSLPQYKKPNEPLALRASQAVATKMADGEAVSLDDALAKAGLGDARQMPAAYTWGENLARFATDPQISGLLLTLGLLGLLIEMQTLHGIAGLVGVLALALFFGTHIYAGFSDAFVLILAVVGLLGILYELHVVPGHGAPGIVGAVLVLVAILLAFGTAFFFVALQTVATAIFATIVLFWLATRAFPQNAWLRKLTFASTQGAEYVTSRDFSALRGRTGHASSYLRPAGVASIDGKRVDVLTEGDFIPAGSPVRVKRVEGARIFVEPGGDNVDKE